MKRNNPNRNLLQVNPFEMCLILFTSIVSALVFDLPLQAVAKMIVTQGIEADIAAEAQRLEDENEKPIEEVIDNPPLHPIEETPEDEVEATETEAVRVQLPLRRRSYSPVDHSWGDDDEDDDDPAVEVDIVEPAGDLADSRKAEDEDVAEEEEEDTDVHDPVGSQSTSTHINGFLSSPGGEHRVEDYGEEDFDEFSDRDELDFSGESDDDSDHREWP